MARLQGLEGHADLLFCPAGWLCHSSRGLLLALKNALLFTGGTSPGNWMEQVIVCGLLGPKMNPFNLV